MNITAMTSTYPSSRMNSLSACSHQPPTSPSTADSTNCIVTAAVGVFLTGWTRPKVAGRTPLRPIPNHIRVATFWQARLAPNTDVNIAIRASHHTPPHTRCAMTSAGNSGEVISLLRLLTPQPITWPQITTTSISPMMTIDAIVARGTLRRGLPAGETLHGEDDREGETRRGADIARIEPVSERLKGKTAVPGVGEPPHSQGQHDEEFHRPDDDDRPDGERYPVVPSQRDQRQSDDHQHPPVEPGHMVVSLDLALEDQPEKSEGRAGHDRRIEHVQPARQEPQPRAEGPADIGVVPASRRELLGQLDQAHAERDHDEEPQQVSERGMSS